MICAYRQFISVLSYPVSSHSFLLIHSSMPKLCFSGKLFPFPYLSPVGELHCFVFFHILQSLCIICFFSQRKLILIYYSSTRYICCYPKGQQQATPLFTMRNRAMPVYKNGMPPFFVGDLAAGRYSAKFFQSIVKRRSHQRYVPDAKADIPVGISAFFLPSSQRRRPVRKTI